MFSKSRSSVDSNSPLLPQSKDSSKSNPSKDSFNSSKESSHSASKSTNSASASNSNASAHDKSKAQSEAQADPKKALDPKHPVSSIPFQMKQW